MAFSPMLEMTITRPTPTDRGGASSYGADMSGLSGKPDLSVGEVGSG